MTAAPEISRVEIPGGMLVRVRGKVDGGFTGFGIPPAYREEVVVDLDGVERVTSSGVRAWLASKTELEHARTVWLARVPPCVVSQLNAVAGFAGRCSVVSLYLPFVCASCGHELRQLLDLRQSYDVALSRPEPVPCPACGATTELDEEPGTYLSFVARAPRPQPSPVVTRLLRDDVGREASLLVEKEISGPITTVRLSGPLRGRQHLVRRLDGLDGKVLVELTHVTAVDSESAADLAAALREGTGSTWFHGGSRELLDLLHAANPDLLHGRVVDARVVVHCEGGCTATVAGITASSRSSAIACPRCGRSTSIETSPTLDLALAHVVDPEVAAALPGAANIDSVARDALPAGFQQIRRLGVGGMAEVFLARRTGPGAFEKLVAVKRILPSLAGNDKFRALFQREARVAALVSHQNVVQTFELQEQNDQLLLVMEYVDGWDLGWLLDRALASSVRPPPPVALRIALDLLAGLTAAHSAVDARGNRAAVVHRDVSSHNVLVSREGVTKVADFGVAKAMGEIGMDTRSAVMGKVAYMAPEQINAALGAVGPHTDVYSAALVLFELLAVEHPFVRSGAFESIQAVLHGPLPPLALDDTELAAVLTCWFDVALARPIEHRFPEAGAALDALRRAVEPRWVDSHAAVSRWAAAVADSCLPTRGAQDSGLTAAADPPLGVAQTGDRTQVLSEEDLAVDDA